jgi:PST family polysaccharide transporter
VVPNALLLREQSFFRISQAGLLAEVISSIVAYLLSRVMDPIFALASKAAVSSFCSFMVLYIYSGTTEFRRPSLGRRLSAVRPLLAFSAYQFGFNFINYFSRNLDNILVGKYLGLGHLGVYDKAYQLMRYPLMLLTFSMTPAIQPVVRMHSGDRDAVRRIHQKFTFKLSLVGAATAVFIHLFAIEIVAVVLGKQWIAVGEIIEVLAISIPIQVVLSTSGSFFQAMGRADLLFRTGVVSAIAMISAIVWGIIQADLIVLSWGLVVAFAISFIQTYVVLHARIFMEGWGEFVKSMLPMTMVMIAMAVGRIV